MAPPYTGETYKWRVECLWVLEGDQPGGKRLPHSRQISLLGTVQQQVTFVLDCSLCRGMINDVHNKEKRENSHSIFCFISSVGARSMVVLEWQLGIVGSAPWHSNRVHTSILNSRETHNKCQWHNSGLVLYPTLPGLGCSFMKRSELP